MTSSQLVSRLTEILGPGGVLTDVAARRVYARDASHMTLGEPHAIALPATAAEACAVVAACATAGVPLVARGAGTGLSGGAVPPEGAVVLASGRLTALGEPNPTWPTIRAEAGVLNEHVSRRVRPRGLHFAPDPSSQSASAIGGNIAENAGGPHCLRHGVTLQHLRRLAWIDARGRAHTTGDGAANARGLDTVSLLCGSEGTLGLVTAADLTLTPDPAAVATLLAFFPALDDATRAVVRLLGEGLLPVAVEMVDQAMLGAVEEAFHFGFPTDVAAAMIVEYGGGVEAVDEDADRTAVLLASAGAREVRRAADDAERAELWKCRKKAFGAVGRLAPSYVTMDVVVPLGQLPDFVAGIQSIKARHGVEIATAFHAGDGNLHPGVHYDDRDPASCDAAHAAADEIIADAIARGGSATGEHGVGIEKLHVLPWQMDAVCARLHHGIKAALDPDGVLNPGKLLPAPDAEHAAPAPVPRGPEFQWDDMTVSAPAACRLGELQAAALARGLWIPLGVPGAGGEPGLAGDPTVGDLLDHLLPTPLLLAGGTTRDLLLASWAETGDGGVFRSGAPVFKNVAGYGLHHMLCGSGGTFVRHRAATLTLRPAPEAARLLHLTGEGDSVAEAAPLWRWLQARTASLARPTAVWDPDGGVYVVLAGRDRPWDLGAVPAEVAAELGPAGWRLAAQHSLSFAEVAAAAAEFLPAWSLVGADWWSAAPRPQATALCPWEPGIRHLGNFGPACFWAPQSAAADPDWAVDQVVAAGQPTPVPPPPAGVPRDLLARLEDVFDPEGRLPRPAWLVPVAEVPGA